MWLLVGLGNPESRYARNRHNAGFMVVDELWRRAGAPAPRLKLGAELSEATLAGEHVLFCKPMEFMNCSGLAVQRAAAFWKIPPSMPWCPRRYGCAVRPAQARPAAGAAVTTACSRSFRNGDPRILPASASASGGLLRAMGRGRLRAGRFREDERRLLPDLIGEAADATEAIVKRRLAGGDEHIQQTKEERKRGGRIGRSSTATPCPAAWPAGT
jgi:hypothetical protein